MAVSKKLRAVYDGIWDGMEVRCANLISNVTERMRLRKLLKNTPPHLFKNQVVSYWKKYKKVSPKWAWYYASKNGIEDPRYIPNDLYYTKIDQHFNNRKLGWGFNDKNYYSKVFAGVKQPETLVRIIGGIFLDGNYQLLTKEQALDIICKEKEAVCKPSLETGSGRGVTFWQTEKERPQIENFLNDKENKDFIIQKTIIQHPELDKVQSIHCESSHY